MLKAMIMMKFVREDSNGTSLLDEALHAYGKEQLNTLIEESVNFCNNEQRSKKVKEKLGEA